MAPPRERLHYIDNLRVLLTFLVILHHSAEAWTTGPHSVTGHTINPLMNLLCGINGSFCMGTFFLVSGYFHPPALARKGTWPFIHDRFMRLALPALVYSFTIRPLQWYFIEYVVDGTTPNPGFIGALPQFFWRHYGFSHLWFLIVLFFFGIAYALLDRSWKRVSPIIPKWANPETVGIQRLLIAVLAVYMLASFVARVRFEPNAWIRFPWPLSIRAVHIPQYVFMFSLGIYAYYGRLFQKFTIRTGVVWTVVAFIPTIIFTPIFRVDAYLGWGWTITGVVSTIRETIMCVGISVGLVVLFREKFNVTGAVLQFLRRTAYAAYIVHLPIVFVFQYLVVDWPLNPLLLFMVVGGATLTCTFAISALLVRLPGVRAVL